MAPQYSSHAVLTVTAVGAVTALGYYLYQKNRKNKIPTNWEPVGKITEMYMYPIKSGRRLEIQHANCTEYGLQSVDSSLPHFRDRCLVIYKESTLEAKTARSYPKILFVEASAVDESHFGLSAPDMENLIFKLPTLNNNIKEGNITMFEQEQIFTIDCGDSAAQWISNYLLGQPSGLRIGFHDGKHRRDVEKYLTKYIRVYPSFDNAAGGMYSDMGTILIMTKTSVDDLKKRIPDSDVTIHNFRPNLIIEGANLKPYEEDKWKWIKIGDVVIKNVMLCPRCSFTTINPETAEFSKDYEPITTMKKYRSTAQFKSESPSPNMGIYGRLSTFGKINTGDIVYLGKH